MCVSDENFGQYHARDFNCPCRDAVQDLRLVRDSLSFSNKKTIFTSSDMYLNICVKSLTCVFIFCLKKIRKKYLFLVLDKETPLRNTNSSSWHSRSIFCIYFCNFLIITWLKNLFSSKYLKKGKIRRLFLSKQFLF